MNHEILPILPNQDSGQPAENSETEVPVYARKKDLPRIERAQKFQKDLETIGELLSDDGTPIELRAEVRRGYEAKFNGGNSRAQGEVASNLSGTIELRLKERLATDLKDLYEIKRGNGYTATNVGQDEKAWTILFTQASRADQLQLVRYLRAEIGDTLVDHFDYYLASWGKILTEMGETPEEIDKEIAKRKEKFNNASDLGKIGTARTLREQLKTASAVKTVTEAKASFMAFLEIYRNQTSEKGLDGEDYPDADHLEREFLEARENRLTWLSNQMHSYTIRALTQKPKNFPSA